MSVDPRELLSLAYPRLSLLLPTIETAEDNQAILLTSPDSTADVCAQALGSLLSQSAILVHADSITKEEWRRITEPIRQQEHQGQLFGEGLPRRLCVILLGLDEAPEWLVQELKSLLENSQRVFACVASAHDPKKISEMLSSHFMRFKQGERPPTPKTRGQAE